MKKRNIGKYSKSYISLFIAGLMMLTACGRVAEVQEPEVTYTQEEIEDRIRHVGRHYDGLDDGYGFSLFSSGGGYATTNSYNGGMVMYDAAVCEDCDDSAVSQSTVSIPVTPIDSDTPWNMEGYNSITESGFT